jgi:hypothetical protein
MAIKFKYRIPENLQPLVDQTVADYGLNYLYGLMPEELVGQLRHCSLYMICEFEYINGLEVWKNPVAVVGQNELRAMETYAENMHKDNGSVLCEIINRCDKITVEPC